MSSTERPPPSRQRTPPEPNRGLWRGWLIPVLLLVGIFAWQSTVARTETQPTVTYSSFYGQIQKENVESVVLRGQEVTGRFRAEATIDGKSIKTFRTMLPAQPDDELMPALRAKGVDVTVESEEQPILVQLLLSALPLFLIIGFMVWMSRRATRMWGEGGPLSGIIKGRSKRFDKETGITVTFDDVAGLKAAKSDLMEVVDFLKNPEKYQRLGGKVPRGLLLVGPPGTGKTLVARAVAGEAGVPFFSINGSEFIELFVGVGASRVRELFEEARKVAPAIVFIDEIDAVGRSRGAGLGGGHDEREQTLNQLLSEMDGFERNDLTIVIAATNRPDVLDPALLRPGRFDRRVTVDRPELAAREAILRVHMKKKPVSDDVKVGEIARITPGFSGADLANLVNEAVLGATRRGAETVEMQDFREAFDKIVLGDPRETKLGPKEKKRVAVHEAGHAVVAHFTPGAEPLQRITILPRGMALGVTMQSPGDDKHLMTQPELESRLRMLMGGYAAERVVLGDVSSGAADDLKKATELAHKMVAHFGMSERVGPVFHEHKTDHPFLGQRLATESGTSDATVHAIEEETRKILAAAVESATQDLKQHREPYDRLVAALLDRETVEREDIEEILGPPPSRDDPASAGTFH